MISAIMSQRIFFNLVTVWFVLLGCAASEKIVTDFDGAYDLPAYTSFRWSNSSTSSIMGTRNEDYDAAVKNAVTAEMLSRRYQLMPDSAVASIHYHIEVNESKYISSFPIVYRAGVHKRKDETLVYQQLTIVIDMVDTKNNSLIWRGIGTTPVEETSPAKIEKLIRRTVRKMFEAFPACTVPT